MEPDGQKGELSGTNTHTTNDTLQLGERTLRPRRKGDFSSSSGEPSPGEDITCHAFKNQMNQQEL